MADRVLLPRQRQDEIQRLLQKKQFASVRELAESTNVSPMTIRRDLETLKSEGVLTRVFGGAQLTKAPVPEQLYTERMKQSRQAKERIARLARSFVQDRDTVALDGSTTAVYLARELRDQPVTVVTNNLLAANELAGGAASVFMPGGTLRNTTRTLVGATVEQALKTINVSRVFFSVSGLHHDVGFSDSNAEEVALKKALFAIAATRVALVDASKFGCVSLHSLIDPKYVNLLLTDAAPEGELRTMLQHAGVNIQVAYG